MGLEFSEALMMVLRWVCTIAFVVVFVVSVVASGDRLRDRGTVGRRDLPSEPEWLQDAEDRQTGDWQQRPDRVQPSSPHHS